MVRETRHLWVGNLPDSIREDRIREHFKRYGRVQNVKLLGRTETPGGSTSMPAGASGVCATVAFMDIKSASKAHNVEHVLDERTLTTEYYEPAAIPAGVASAGSSPAGSGYSGSSSSVNSAPAPLPAAATAAAAATAPPANTSASSTATRYHPSGSEEVSPTCALAATAAAPANWRGTNDSASDYCRRGSTPAAYGRYARTSSATAPYATPPNNVDRSTAHHRWYSSGGERGATGGESTPSTPGGGTDSGRRRRRSGSGSSRSDSSSAEPSDGSRASTPAAGHHAAHHHVARTPPSHHQWAATASGRPLAICVRNLPTRSTDSSLKDGLYHEYKKHGKVMWVKVVGQNADRYAVVRFKKPSDVEKALEVSQDKLFFGCKISVAPHQSCDEDADSAKPYETDIDEYHPKATRTLFIGNLEKDVTQQQLRDKFKHFGRIIEIDIKKGSGGGAGYAFCQYAAISSVVEAIRSMDGEYVGGSRVKLGFGKPVATTCVWVDGLTETTEKQVLACVARCGAATSVCVDRAAGAALVHFEQAGAAGAAVRELRRVAAHASAAEPDRPRLAVDYASRECQEAFYEQLEKHGGAAALAPPDPAAAAAVASTAASRYPAATPRHDSLRYDSCGSRSRASSYGRSSSRTPRYSALEHYDPADYAADRRYRVYDELGNSSQPEEIPLYEDRLQSVVVSSPHRSRHRHRRDSSPEDRKHSKERHRSVTISGVRRSRSGSCGGGERHSGRRRHRRRCEGSGSRGSRAGTPLRDEVEAAPCEPRRAPRERPPRPMSLPLPRFALQLLRGAPAAPRPAPGAAAAPDSPPRPRSASSSSAGSAPHSPSIEERIRSLDEKLSGTRGAPDLPDRSRLRNRLFELDINEVKPSEVVRSLLAKRSVFDEDSERLEGAGRAPSPGTGSRARPPPAVPRALRYPFPVHPPPTPPTPIVSTAPTTPSTPAPLLTDIDQIDRPADPRLNRPERPYVLEKLGKFNESDYKIESRVRLRTPSIDKVQPDLTDRWQSPRPDAVDQEKDKKKNTELVRRNSLNNVREGEWKERRLSIESDILSKRTDSVNCIRDVQAKKERQLSIELESELKRRNSLNSIGEAQIKIEKSSPTEGESENKRRNSITLTREAQIKVERLLSVETEPSPKTIIANNEKQLFVELSSETNSQDLLSVDLMSQNNDEKQLPVDSETKKAEPIHVSQEIEDKDEKQLTLEAEEREIKEAIEKIDPDNKDIQSLINDDKIQQQNIKAELSNDDKSICHTENVTVDRIEKPQDTSISTKIDSSARKLHVQHTEKPPLDDDVSVESAASHNQLKCDNIVKSNSAELAQKKVKPEIESEPCKDILIQNHINKELLEFEIQHGHLNSMKSSKNISEIGQELLKNSDKNGKERYNQNMILEAFHTKLEKENIQFDKQISKDQFPSIPFPNDKKTSDTEKHAEDRGRSDREKSKHSKDRVEKDRHDTEKDKTKTLRNEKGNTEKKCKEESGIEKSHHDKKSEKENEKHKDKIDKDKSKHNDEKKSRQDHHRRDRSDRDDDKKRDKRKEDDGDVSKAKKDEKHRYERSKKENVDSKRDSKKDDTKSRKSSRDETTKDLYRKDSTDSSTSRASHESSKLKEIEHPEIKDEPKPKQKCFIDLFSKLESEKESSSKLLGEKSEAQVKIKSETKEEKDVTSKHNKHKIENSIEYLSKCKSEVTEKPRHYSLDSPSVDSKRKERLNSCSSLPSSLGQKRRISSQENADAAIEDVKKNKPAIKTPERRDSKDGRNSERPKTTKFNKGHFAKIIESKTKDDKKNQVKPPDESLDFDISTQKSVKSNAQDHDKKLTNDPEQEGLQNHLDFLATLELRSSEEDERQKALRNEMKEKKRIQQLQQIQELQMQQDALQHAELIAKLKDEKKKSDDKKKEAARDKRMSTERKSREEKSDSGKRKNRKQFSTDSSDSDEPKKNHSIFDVVDDEPAYISMYDKVKARSCKNMQKQEEEKRQEKIKAKFSQLKQSRAKREEKKRSSWDEDSDSEHERTKPHKPSVDSSTDDDHFVHDKKCAKLHGSAFEFDRNKINDYFSTPSNEEDSRNKLSRKNSRSRIISDTSDDDGSKRSFSKSPSFFNDIRKEFMTDYESMQRIRHEVTIKESSDRIKKNSLLNLFGKSDSDDSKLKSGFDSSDKSSLTKTMSNDFSSEGENVACNRTPNEIRKKHKKKIKKHKFSFSDDDSKIDKNELILDDTSKLENQRQCIKKEKRRDRVQDSIDGDDNREAKTKTKKERNLSSFDHVEPNFNNKKDGKMEDIFGPLSDDSDRDLPQNNNVDFSRHDFDSTFDFPSAQVSAVPNNEDNKNKESGKPKKEKRRKEKRLVFMKEDENSLDVDAVSKAIEARLFADNDENEQEHINTGGPTQTNSKSIHNNFEYANNQYTDTAKLDRPIDKVKKKKKKKNREDRQNRREHHYHFNHHHEKKQEPISTNSMLLDIPLPNDTGKVESVENISEKKLASESPSLPRLTDSPPIAPVLTEIDSKNRDSDATDCSGGDHNMEVENVGKKAIEVNDIPMPPPLENIVQHISDVPLPSDPSPENEDQRKVDSFLPNFCRDNDVSEYAVRSITNFEKDCNKQADKIENLSPKAGQKLEEKPRAVISQEETEDAVAALLGESFGEKDDSFANYEEVDNDASHQIEIECSATTNENIPEEDAEEMRQAVQNLNACEMEMKPDTPVSDNDLLLIDTDTEEADESVQDNIGRSPANVISTNHALSRLTEQKFDETTEAPTSTQNSSLLRNSDTKEPSLKINEADIKIHLPKRDPISTATPVITSLALTNNKSLETHVMNIKTTQLSNRENDIKPTHITANIVQIRAPQTQSGATLRPILAPNRGSTPYQVVNHVIRPQAALNMQPPTIKIPEPHIMYQRPQGIVISPRMSKDPRLQSPKGSPQGESMPSPRLSNVAFLNTSPQNINSMSLTTPTSIQQRSPGQVTVVRMQQPPLSPIQAIHLPPGTRTMVSPNRPNSVLVQTQGAPIHLNRLPVTPVLAPISKPLATGNILQQNKVTGTGTSSLFQQQKVVVGESRRTDHRLVPDNVTDHSKIILSSTSLQHSTNPTVMAQNRLISMQNALHSGNIHLNNKILPNSVCHLNEKRDALIPKSDQQNYVSYSTAPIIRIAGANHTTASIIQSGSKPIMSAVQDPNPIIRGQGSNVIHTFNSQRLLTTAPISNVIQIDAKTAPSVLSMAAIRPPTVLTKSELPSSVAVSCNSQTNIVMAPLILKTSTAPSSLLFPSNMKSEGITEAQVSSKPQHSDDKQKDLEQVSSVIFDKYSSEIHKDSKAKHAKSPTLSKESIAKCETDFEELLKDNTNEIKITNHPNKKLEVNVGKTVTTFPTNIHINERALSIDSSKKEVEDQIDSKLDAVGNAKVTVCENKSIDACAEQSIKTEFPDKKNDFNVNEKTDHEKTSVQSSLDLLSAGPKKIEFSAAETNFSNQLICSTQIKNIDENDSWSAKDLNIESVIKKVDSLCNESDTDRTDDANEILTKDTSVTKPNTDDLTLKDILKPMDIEMESNPVGNSEDLTDRNVTTSKRGGRSIRGKRAEKNQDRVQTRQIGKSGRGGTSAKRGRGRAKVDKKMHNLIHNSVNNLPGDVYDFHEDSGDETSASLNKNDNRPRLILTIKSPVTVNTSPVATASLSITAKEETSPKDQIKIQEKSEKEDKAEDFMSPLANTRKSRRLQQKDVQRTTVDDVIDDVVKGSSTKSPAKDNNKKRPTRQIGAKAIQTEKASALDTRKSPRGMKRTRDRSLSDVSVDSNSCPADSNEEKSAKKDELPKPVEPKKPKLSEPPVTPKSEPNTPQPAKTTMNAPANISPVVPPTSAPTPTPIMKPPKKMISEISAKLASAFEAAASLGPTRQAAPAEAEKLAPIPREIRNPEFATAAPAASELMAAATGDARVGSEMAFASVGEAALARRLDAAGAAEAGDARVQSPALPHRPPDTHHAHRPPDRANPLLIRGGDGEGVSLGVGVGVGVGAGAGVGGCAAGPPPRAYAGPASLPRGAHHPPPPAVPLPSHHHHPGAASRVTITSIPSISPQGQIGLGDGMYPHFSHQHYQMYQQHFRATQHENRVTPPYTRPLDVEGCEAATPPLELRRPPSARVPRPAHSPSLPPADRLIMYACGTTAGRSPPPAHAHTLGPGPGPAALSLSLSRLPAALPPALAPGPPHAAHAPREADSLHSLLQRYPVMWQGLLALKNDSAAVQMHFVGGNMGVAGDTLPRHTDGSTPPLRIAQRMRLEPAQLDQVHRKMKLESEHCMLLALPCGRDHMDVLQQSTNLTAGFITYLQRKQAAGIVNVAPPGHHQAMYTVHIFPSCDFANENLNRIAPDLMHRVADIAHLLIVIATV